MQPIETTTKADELPRNLGPVTAFCLIVGSVIGSGIFLVPAWVAHNVPSVAGIVALWVVGGLFSLAGALTLAELGAMLPRAGGPYVYLREAYGRLPAFLFGWTEFLVIRSGSVATLSAAFAIYASQPQLFPAPKGMSPTVWQAILACGAMAAVAAINVVGTRASGSVQVLGTVLKLGTLSAMIVVPFVLGKAHVSNLEMGWQVTREPAFLEHCLVAMVAILWAYDGWVNAASMAEEIRDPGRNIPRALSWGLAVLIVFYLAMTLVYHLVLPMGEVAGSYTAAKGSGGEVAALFCKRLLGDRGAMAISLVVVCSTLIALNGNALSGPRAYFAMARDGLFPAFLCRIHPRFKTPANAILTQAAWSIALMVAATSFLVIEPPKAGFLPGWVVDAWAEFHKKPVYDIMYNYVIFGGTVFYTLAIASVFVLRVTRPGLIRPYKTWGYPLTPLLYVAASLLLIYNMLKEPKTRIESLTGLGIIVAGLPAFLVFSGRKPPSAIEAEEV